MLLLLRIQDFALIDSLELEFGAGLNVLTGETGAGKSIILDAIDVVLGGKVNSRMIRTGSDRSFIEATFALHSGVSSWLTQQEVEPLEEQVLICSRELATGTTSMRSRCRVNGVLVNRQAIEELRSQLVEITAQGQTVQLISPAVQRHLLDAFGGNPVQQKLDEVAQAYQAAQIVAQALEKRHQSAQYRLQRLDLLQYQSQELKSAQLQNPEELEHLQQEQDRLAHVVELQQLSYQAYQLLYQNESDSSVTDLLGKAEGILISMVGYDPQLQPVLDLVNSAALAVVEAGNQVNAYGDDLESDPVHLEEVTQRIQLLKQICRKYGATLGEAIAYQTQIEAELLELTDSEQSLEELTEQHQQLEKQLGLACLELTSLRRSAAQTLESSLVVELRPLAMEKVQFQVQISPMAATVNGADQVEFRFSPNPGEPLQSLAATASGGEMSRFLLALKACFVGTSDRETLIFDEIDVGVSGKVAQAIADKLHTLSLTQQVLCITHQPLVAALADQHFRVDKQIINQPVEEPHHLDDLDNPDLQSDENKENIRTVVRVSTLDNQTQRQEELAQLAGGKSDPEALLFAASLLSQAAHKRHSDNTSTPSAK